MATEVQNENASLASLVTGVVDDARDLLQQQLTLFRSELKQDLRNSREIASSLVIGGVLALVAAGLLTTMLVFLVNYFTGWHLAWCYLLVGGLVGAVAGVLIMRALARLQKFQPLDQTTEAMQENLEWKTKGTRR